MTESFLTQRPEPDEHQPFYAGYIATAPDGSVLATLEEQRRTTVGLLAEFDEATGNFRYAPGKWSVKEVLGHLVDSERVFAGRALAFARADRGHCPGMDQDAWVSEARFDRRRLTDLVDDFDAVRVATIRLFAGLVEDEWPRRGIGSGVEFSVRALAWIIAGHERHHVTVLRERYLSARP